MTKVKENLLHVTIGDKEVELKLTFKGIKYLETKFNSVMEVIAAAMQGGFEAYQEILYAATLGQEVTKEDIVNYIDTSIEAETLNADIMYKQMNTVVTECFFYRPTVNKFLTQSKDMKEVYQLMMA